MHTYLRAIGFSEIEKESDKEKLLDRVFKDFSRRYIAKEKDSVFVEMEKEFAPDMGIKLCGILDRDGFHRQYYFPYYKGSSVTTTEEVAVEKRISGDAYSGVCDDGRVGVSLIFYLQNAADYRREEFFQRLFHRRMETTFSGLSTDGRILFPVKKNVTETITQQNSLAQRSQLMSAARSGDPEAIEDLTMEDMDLYAMISRRVYSEDLYSIVDTFFMPYGIECDQYQIMGNILHYEKVRNLLTKEYIYQINLECNDLKFDICINESDLTGDPEVGRRFKGTIWLQGSVNFE